jgi:hypothetical protein
MVEAAVEDELPDCTLMDEIDSSQILILPRGGRRVVLLVSSEKCTLLTLLVLWLLKRLPWLLLVLLPTGKLLLLTLENDGLDCDPLKEPMLEVLEVEDEPAEDPLNSGTLYDEMLVMPLPLPTAEVG